MLRHQLPCRCRLIKIDTEGMEAEVLQGAVKTIKQFKPAIYYKAVYDEEANVLSPKTQAAARLVKGLHYDQYWHFSRRFVDDNYFGNSGLKIAISLAFKLIFQL